MKILQKGKALLQLIRPELPIAAGICVVVGEVIALGKFPVLADGFLGFTLGLFLSSSAMIFNDIFDLEVDRINTPHKPIPSGKVNIREAIVFGILTAVIACWIALMIDPLLFLLSLVLWIMGFLYNWKVKSVGLMGNLIVSLNVGMTLIFGGIIVGQVSNALIWIFGLIAFVFDLAEEIAGDAMDMEGDRKRGSRSLAIVHGKGFALKISAILFGVMILLTLLPILIGETSLAYILPIVIMDIAIVYFLIRLLRSATHQEGHQAMRGLYISATIGLVAFILSRFLK